eukprot:TRINITY_DN95410_c0_g1_i1.p1 TRINITY_DN95410_c0_g1~~TRINITY_DN95410_c0_g1_i1.p1  ORF type:complete len:391 (+),score=37.62 TRINITY_DN95410_c0_g1_i1:59-1231(+)
MALRSPLHTCLGVAHLLQLSVRFVAGNPKLHALTYSSTVDERLALPFASGEFYGIYPVVVGYGSESAWAYGLSKLANRVRSYIWNHTEPDDIVLFFDAFDTIFLGTSDEIVSRYLQMESRYQRKLFYNADPVCTTPCEHEETIASKINSSWRYLNSGIYIGRSSVFREIYRDPIPDPLVDKQGQPKRWQYFHVEYYVEHTETVAVDSNCEMLQLVYNVDNLYINTQHASFSNKPGGHGLKISGGKLHNTMTDSFPLIAHFAGPGHYPNYRDSVRRGSCAAYEVMRAIGHPQLVKLWEKEYRSYNYFILRPWRSMCSKTESDWDKLGMHVSKFEDNVISVTGFDIGPLGFLVVTLAASVSTYLLGRRLLPKAVLHILSRRRAVEVSTAKHS